MCRVLCLVLSRAFAVAAAAAADACVPMERDHAAMPPTSRSRSRRRTAAVRTLRVATTPLSSANTTAITGGARIAMRAHAAALAKFQFNDGMAVSHCKCCKAFPGVHGCQILEHREDGKLLLCLCEECDVPPKCSPAESAWQRCCCRQCGEAAGPDASGVPLTAGDSCCTRILTSPTATAGARCKTCRFTCTAPRQSVEKHCVAPICHGTCYLYGCICRYVLACTHTGLIIVRLHSAGDRGHRRQGLGLPDSERA